MTHIHARPRGDGSIAYTARIRLPVAGRTHTETRTFSQRENAVEWASRREAELKTGDLDLGRTDPIPLSSLIRSYLDQFPDTSGSKRRHLEFLLNDPLASEDVRVLTSARLVQHIRARRSKGISGATALNELIWIGVVLHGMRACHGDCVQPDVAEDARSICRAQQLIATSAPRDRVPTPQELASLSAYFAGQDGRAEIPMKDLLWLAIHGRLRAADLCYLEWKYIDYSAHTAQIPDAHACRASDGGLARKIVSFTPDAWDIVRRLSRASPYVCPFKPRSICVAFSRACESLGIEHLSFDDLRWYGQAARNTAIASIGAHGCAPDEEVPPAQRPVPPRAL
jgi:integrase